MHQLDFVLVFAAFDELLRGAALTVQLSLSAVVIGIVVSILGAAAKTAAIKPLTFLIDVYIEVIRNTPFLVQIFFIFFGLPAIGIRLSPNEAALLALVVNFGAYGIEIIRAGIESIESGQIEAGRALGLRPGQIFRFIILRPALRTVYPALTSQFIYLMLTSSVVSVISAGDLAAAGADIQSRTFASFEVYIVVTAIYLALSLAFSGLFATIGRLAFSYPMSR